MANDNIWVFGKVLCGKEPAVGARVRVWLRVGRTSQANNTTGEPAETTTGSNGEWSICFYSGDFVTNVVDFQGINFRVSCPDCQHSNNRESDPPHTMVLKPKDKDALKVWAEELVSPGKALEVLGLNLPPWLDLMSLSSVTWAVYAGQAPTVSCPVEKAGRVPR